MKTNGYRASCVVLAAAVTAWFCWEAVERPGAERLVWIGLAVASALVAFRASRLRVVVTSEAVVVHSWTGRRRVAIEDIASVLQTPFVGKWPAEIPVDWWNRVLIRRTDGSDINLPLVSFDRRGDGGQAACAARRLERLLQAG